MVFKNLCVLVLWTDVASALEGLRYFRLYVCRDTVQLGEEELKQIESGVHFPTFSNEKHGVLRTKVEQGKHASLFCRIFIRKIVCNPGAKVIARIR